MRTSITTILIIACSIAAGDSNYPGHKAHVVNTCPHVELSGFSYRNEFRDRSMRFVQSLSWKNVGTHPIVAFEVVILKYDAFDERMVGSRWVVTGHDSADWSPLQPGATASDGTIGYGTEEVFTAFAYVRKARLADGTVWKADDQMIVKEVAKALPNSAQVGSVAPDPKPSKNESE